MDVVEINPGCIDLIKNYPLQRKILQDSRIYIFIGDGCKFLRSQKPEEYDIIVLNTTWYWRNYSTLMLSKEFLNLAKSKLKQDGIIAYNSTGFLHSYGTALSVFPFACMYDNFIIVGLAKTSAGMTLPPSCNILLRTVFPFSRHLINP